jgi:predicted Fe-Mo cluster-binding NifX family protein
MKIAVATNDEQTVSGHIGRCRAFVVFEIEEGKIISKEFRENVFTSHHKPEAVHHEHGEGAGHNHSQLIEGLKDCSALISHGGGWRVVEDLRQNNIQPIFTDMILVDDAVRSYISGSLVHQSELTCAGGNHHAH